MPRYSGFIGPSYVSQSIVAADDRTVNWIPAQIESGTGAAPYVFDPAPGFHLLADSAGFGGICRGSYELNRDCYMVLGNQLCKVVPSPAAISTLLTIAGTGVASISGNGASGHQLMVANTSGTLYWIDLTGGINGTIAGVNGHILAFLNGYFIALNTTTSSIFVSALEDGSTWDPLDVAQRNDYPDKWRTMIVRAPDLLLFGSESISVYYNDPTSDFPFVPNLNVAIRRGIQAPASLAMLQTNPIWLADDNTVRLMQGYTPVRVSTHAIEYAISQLTYTADADGFTYNEQGHSIYVLNLPNGGSSSLSLSFGYDLTTGLWHERGPFVSGTFFSVLPVVYGASAASTSDPQQRFNIVGSRLDGKVFFMSQTYATELDGTTGITRLRRAPQIVSELNRIIYDKFQLFMEVGTATASGPGSTPTVLLQYSNDGGHTFNTGTSVSAGLTTAWNTRVIWRKLGQGRQRVFQITASDPIPWRLVDAFIEYRVGAS